MKTQHIIAICFGMIMMVSCNNDSDQSGDADINEKSQALVQADNEFGISMFSKVTENETATNYMISPLSISLALGMAYNGAEGDTRTEMEEAMLLSGLTREEINQLYQELVDTLLNVDSKVTLEIANSIWYEQTFDVLSSFLTINQTYYDAEVASKNFSDQQTVTDINNWVSEKTHEKITSIIDQISPEMVMYLINAVYFKGTWTKEFNKESTIDWSFTCEDGSSVTVNGMLRRDTLAYVSNDTFSSIEIPYGQGNYQMILMLPNSGKTTDDIVSQFSPSNWKSWQEGLSSDERVPVEIMLPRFEFSYEITLNDVLKALGIKEAFTDTADFTSIASEGGIYISEVKHKTYIKTDEEGSEASAVTSIGYAATSIGGDEPTNEPFYCERPFLFAIVEKNSGAIIFIGKVGNPNENGE